LKNQWRNMVVNSSGDAGEELQATRRSSMTVSSPDLPWWEGNEDQREDWIDLIKSSGIPSERASNVSSAALNFGTAAVETSAARRRQFRSR
jgi:hypothetical protein